MSLPDIGTVIVISTSLTLQMPDTYSTFHLH